MLRCGGRKGKRERREQYKTSKATECVRVRRRGWIIGYVDEADDGGGGVP